jgi:predicted nucleic acid-binding protein
LARALTIDASVFVRASVPREGGFEESRDFLLALGRSGRPVVLPTLVRPEVAGAISRGGHGTGSTLEVLAEIDNVPGVTFVPLDGPLAEEAAHLAMMTHLRGADAVYAATARRFDAILVTLDAEQRRRLPADITACSPAEALGLWDPASPAGLASGRPRPGCPSPAGYFALPNSLRRTAAFLSPWIPSVGLSSLGQASPQFMIV